MYGARRQIVKSSRWQQFIRNVDFDLRVFCVFLVIVCGFRIAFIVTMREYISDLATNADYWQTAFSGLRISLKSAGVIGLLTLLFSTLPSVLLNKEFLRPRRYIAFAFATMFSFLFFARIPYYEIFNSGFNYMVFNGVHEDMFALLETMYKQYNLVPRLLGAFFVTAGLCYCLKWLLLPHPQIGFPMRYAADLRSLVSRFIFVAVLIVFMVFVRFGGSLTYAYSIHWENSAVTKDHLLNEAVLDDLQGMYRAYSQNRALKRAAVLAVTPESIREYGELLAGKAITGNRVSQYLQHEAQGAKLPKPRHIFLIVAESYANWPLWAKYQDINIANGLHLLIAQDDSFYLPSFLPAGHGTITSINGLISGLAEVNVSTNYQPESYKSIYETAFAPQIRKLGYETYFWYGGFPSWQHLRDFSLAQGFDYFYGANDFPEKTGNAWGVADHVLFETIQTQFSNERPSFHMILTTSNHPPFTIDVEGDGFDASLVQGLPQRVSLSNKDWKDKLGHFWYADKHIAAFIHTMRQRCPESLFAITGDHSDRMTLEPDPDLFTRYSIPFILHGQGIHKNLFSPHTSGTQLDILPTLIELIAPRGFVYYSLGCSLTTNPQIAANHQFWLNDGAMGRLDSKNAEKDTIPYSDNRLKLLATERESSAKQALSWWRVMRGDAF